MGSLPLSDQSTGGDGSSKERLPTCSPDLGVPGLGQYEELSPRVPEEEGRGVVAG